MNDETVNAKHNYTPFACSLIISGRRLVEAIQESNTDHLFLVIKRGPSDLYPGHGVPELFHNYYYLRGTFDEIDRIAEKVK